MIKPSRSEKQEVQIPHFVRDDSAYDLRSNTEIDLKEEHYDTEPF
jgi:hypothetical protein